MQYRLVESSPGNRRLLLLYAGWAMDSRPFSSLSYPGYDVAVVWDYTDLESPLPISDDYCEICLIAWSYGVYAGDTWRLFVQDYTQDCSKWHNVSY